jgi:hypothetical protein
MLGRELLAAHGTSSQRVSHALRLAGAAATGSRRTPISRAVGCSLISRGSDAAATVAVILDAISSMNWIADI